MERLTNRIFVPKGEREVVVFTQGEYIDTMPAEMTHEDIRKVLRKLCEYEDLEEQGLLLRLPCKVGDIIWDNDFGKLCAYRITGFSFGEADGYIDDPVITDDIVYYYSNYNGSIMGSFSINEIGKSLFLTQAEAEQKLKEMESESK